ncbi:putative methyltransferase [Tahibacter aquaticus]|uniref:Putative methyltransferase n=1 Tax=Tahibacter aquaticus TaxID=520092 RepID=A0A4R6Z6V0_9GAMM|nr:class I SAM-dependent methyltransferase [Tahibacter aquaticus]TDR47493.1 putative methyltransferase [Tahibacter aquaticus]
MLDMPALKKFFHADTWRQSIDRFPLSGMALVDTVNQLQPRVVVDVGCGFNPFKGKIRNLVGIDIVNEHADIVCDLHDAPFKAESVDVALALGSINFGTEQHILDALAVVSRWLVPGGRLFMRGNPGQSVDPSVPIFPWSAQRVQDYGSRVGLALGGEVREETLIDAWDKPIRRLFWSYAKVGA